MASAVHDMVVREAMDTVGISGDLQMRALARDACAGDTAAGERLERETRRRESPMEHATRVMREYLCRKPGAATLTERGATAWLAATGRTRLAPGVRAALGDVAGEVCREHDRACVDCAWTLAVAQDSLLVRLAADKAAADALWHGVPRALGRPCLADALDAVQCRTRERTVSVDDLVRLIARARESDGLKACAAPHDVAKSYRYPVTYSCATAVAIGDVVRLTVTRTVTWGSGRRESVRLLVPSDVVRS